MKKLILFLLAGLFSVYISAQAPQAFKYQMVMRDNAGNLLSNKQVGIRLSILQGSASGPVVYAETQAATTNPEGLLSLSVGNGTILGDSLKNVDWSTGTFFLKTEVDPSGGSSYQLMGTSQLLSVPYAMYAGKVNNKSTFEVVGDPSKPDSALFEVKDHNGLTVFAVYENGAVLYVKSGAKGGQAGFAVGGRSSNKGSTVIQNILTVTPDSVAISINDKLPTGNGFTVTGQNTAGTGTGNEYFSVTPSLTKVVVNEASKGGQAGFAVGGRSAKKGSPDEFFNISSSSTVSDTINPSQPRMLWYPLKEAFLTGRVLIESPDSVGLNSFSSGYESKSIGNYSQALGFRTAARGMNSTAIGYQSTATGINSFALGDYALSSNANSFAFGQGAVASGQGSYSFGYNTLASGYGSFALGGQSGSSTTEARGSSSFSFGLGTKAMNYGDVAIGILDTASGGSSTALGYQNVASGGSSIAMGYQAKATAGISVSMGYQTQANGTFSLANGVLCVADGYASSAIGYMNHSKDYYCTSIGFNNVAGPGEAAFASGYETVAANNGAAAMGWFSQARGYYSLSTGFDTYTSGMASSAFGMYTVATGIASAAMGMYSRAPGDNATAMGSYATARPFASLAVGRYNDTTTLSLTAWNTSDPLIIAGNGSGSSSRSNAMTLYKNGNMTIAGTLTQSSDRRLKENIVPFTNATAILEGINPVYFTFKNTETHPSGRQIGFIAQEVQKVLPELVEKDGMGYLSVDYGKMSVILLQAFKEQQQQINSMKQENDQLKAQHQSLQTQLDKLNALQSQVNELKELMGRSAANK